MAAHLGEWVNLALRWVHVVTGVAWIGTSFYFNWLNSRLAPPEVPEPGVAGEVWSVHGGGFYRVVKYTVAPGSLPRTLHGFKWEAYATWLSGIALLVLIYYLGAGVYLIDARVAGLGRGAAVAIGLATLVAAWVVYDLLCRSPLGKEPLALAGTLFVLGVALTWGLTRLLSARAAYIHVGAALGTIMAANVFRVIIPSQREMVAAMAEGRPPNATLGRQAALRSLHTRTGGASPPERLAPPRSGGRDGGPGARHGSARGRRGGGRERVIRGRPPHSRAPLRAVPLRGAHLPRVHWGAEGPDPRHAGRHPRTARADPDRSGEDAHHAPGQCDGHDGRGAGAARPLDSGRGA